MRKDLQRRFDAHTRVNRVCAENSPIFDGTPGGTAMRTDLDGYVTTVDRLFGVQQRSLEEARAAAADKRLSRETLRDAAKAIVKVGRVVKLDDVNMTTMQLPATASDDELLAYSRGLVDRVSTHADAFIAKGLPPDLLKHLGDGIGAFVTARNAHAAAREAFTAATQSIRDTQEQADKTVDVLEAIAVNTPAARPEVLTKLRNAKRIGPRASAPPAKPATPATPPAAPTPSTAPTPSSAPTTEAA